MVKPGHEVIHVRRSGIGEVEEARPIPQIRAVDHGISVQIGKDGVDGDVTRGISRKPVK